MALAAVLLGLACARVPVLPGAMARWELRLQTVLVHGLQAAAADEQAALARPASGWGCPALPGAVLSWLRLCLALGVRGWCMLVLCWPAGLRTWQAVASGAQLPAALAGCTCAPAQRQARHNPEEEATGAVSAHRGALTLSSGAAGCQAACRVGCTTCFADVPGAALCQDELLLEL